MITKRIRFSTVKPLILLTGLMLLFAIAAVACGGGDDSEGSGAAVSEAPAKSEAPTPAPKKSVHEETEKKDDSKVSSAAATATVAAVKKTDPTATAAPVQKDRNGGSLQWGTIANNNHVFFQQYTPGAGAAWAMMVGDPLMAYGKGSEWLPEKSMAESFEVSPDGQTITFKVRSGVKFHDGTDYNAFVHAWNLNWVLDPDNAAVTRPQISAINKVTAIDDVTLEIQTDRVYTPLLNALGMMGGMPFSKIEYEEKGEDHLRTFGSSSTGPFMVDEWIQGEKMVMKANRDYYHQEDTYPYLDEVVWVEIPDLQVRGAALAAGQIDVADIDSKGVDVIAQLRKTDGLFEAKGMAGVRLSHHNAARAPFDDLRVRQAAQMAIDRHAWNEVLQGGEGHVYMGSVLPPTSAFAYEVDEYMYEYNPEKARELLEEYAAEKGLTLPLTTMSAFKCTDEQLEIGCTDLIEAPITVTTTTSSANVARAEFEAAAYNAVGFEVTMNLGEGKEGPRTFVTKEASFSLRGFGVRPHPAGSLDSYMGYGGYWNNGSYGTSDAQMELHETLIEAGEAFEYQDQVRLYKKAQQIYMEHALGGVKHANNPAFKYWTEDVRYDGYPDYTNVYFPSDTSLKLYGMWLDR
jgi:ABC-type transport system substrate-binding protein